MGEGGIHVYRIDYNLGHSRASGFPFMSVRDSLRTDIIGERGGLDPPLGNLSEPAGHEK